jgi:hypothetical protein
VAATRTEEQRGCANCVTSFPPESCSTLSGHGEKLG